MPDGFGICGGCALSLSCFTCFPVKGGYSARNIRSSVAACAIALEAGFFFTVPDIRSYVYPNGALPFFVTCGRRAAPRELDSPHPPTGSPDPPPAQAVQLNAER